MATKDAANPSAAEEPTNDVNPLTKFVTTSYVIDSINTALEDAMKQDGIESRSDAQKSSTGEKRSFFGLQKRMPDGSTRKATDEEMSSQDMKNKLEQAAQLTSKMSLEEKIEWAQKQRKEGNALYEAKKYKEAIDIYLTCLVVRDISKEKVDDQEYLILPVMNNLAQCALQLGWYYKAEVFCTLAMESSDDTRKGQSIAKLYFKRGKARRLRGLYDKAKIDLDIAMMKLETKSNGDETEMSPEQKAIEREFQLLAKAVAEGKKNRLRAQKAMQKVLGSGGSGEEKRNDSATKGSTPNQDSKAANSSTIPEPPKPVAVKKKDTEDVSTPLYHEKHGRTHSTIRKRPEGPPPYERPRLSDELSYWQMYRLVLARVAQRLLDVIGEEEGSDFGSSSRPLETDGRRMKQE